MTEQDIQIFLQNVTHEDLEKLNKNYNNYIKEKTILKSINRRLASCKKSKYSRPKPTERELDIKENIDRAKHISKRKKHIINASLFGPHQIDELNIDGVNFNAKVLDKKAYLKLFFKIKKEKITTTYSYLIVSLVSLIGAMNTAGLGIALGSIPFGISTILLLCLSTLAAVKHQENKQVITKWVPKDEISQNQIHDFIKNMQEDYTKEKEHAIEMHVTDALFLDSIEDICQRSISYHKKVINGLIEEIMNILEKNGISCTKKDIADIPNALSQNMQKKLS